MKIHPFLASVAMVAVLALSGTADAQVLGGGVTAGVGGSIAGGRGDMGAMGSGRIGARPDIPHTTRSLGSRAHDRAAQTIESTRQRANATAGHAAATATGALNTTADAVGRVAASGQATGEASANLGAAGDVIVTDLTGALSGNAGLSGASAATVVEDAATTGLQSQQQARDTLGGAVNSAVQAIDSRATAPGAEAADSAEFPRPKVNAAGGTNATGEMQVSTDPNANANANANAGAEVGISLDN
jgi:hypothetical protein